MKKILLLIYLTTFIFAKDILLDRKDTHNYLLEIRKYQEKNQKKCKLYIFKKEKNKTIFDHGFYLPFMKEECYFNGRIYYGKPADNNIKGKFQKFHVPSSSYFTDKARQYMRGDKFMLIGNKINKKDVEIAKRKKKNSNYNEMYKYRLMHYPDKGQFYGRTRLLFFIPYNKNIPSFFTSIDTKNQKKWAVEFTLKGAMKDKRIKTHVYFEKKVYGTANKILLKFNEEKKAFRDKYYFDLSDLQKQGIAEPTPMWDAKVKPYKNVFGEELLD